MSDTPQTPVWFITGASAGFGHAIALEALSRGHKVIASSRSVSSMGALAAAGAHTIALDVTSPQSSIEAVANTAVSKYGYITYPINTAGYMLFGAVEESSPAEDSVIFNTNVLGTLNVCKTFLPHMRATASAQHTTIANFGSIGSWFSSAGFSLYSATKFAVTGLSEGMRDELAPLGISVTVIEPGYFRTDFLNPSKRVRSAKVLDCYSETAVGAGLKVAEGADGKQPGDVGKAGKIIVDVLCKEGVGKGKVVPIRIPLGSDAPAAIGRKCTSTLELLEEWGDVMTKTDHE